MTLSNLSRTRVLPAQAFHLADAANWPGIQRDGLLCANTLLRRAGWHAASDVQRTEAAVLPDGVRLRDQAPMPPAALARCLDPGTSPQDWYALLNGFVFFWLDRDRVGRHLLAQRGRPCLLLVFDTQRLVAQCEDRVFVTPFNIGQARRRPTPRGRRTLVPARRWLSDGWAAEARPGGACRPASAPPIELAARGDLPQALRALLRVEPISPQDFAR